MSNSNILLVEDDTAFLAFVGKRLKEQGFSVDRTATYETAEALLTARQYEVVVVDVSRPGVPATDRWDLLDIARRQHPEAVRILLSSCDAPHERSPEGSDDEDVVVLNGPLPLHEISHAVVQSLRASV